MLFLLSASKCTKTKILSPKNLRAENFGLEREISGLRIQNYLELKLKCVGDTVLEVADAISAIILEKGNLKDYRDQTIYAVSQMNALAKIITYLLICKIRSKKGIPTY